MQAPDTPADEADRLAALHALRLLDTPPERRFDRITRLAARALGAPIALVSLVDADRQYFKSACGLDAREGPRATSFCGHAILGAGPFVVPDACADPRFADNPAVTGDLHVRAYAGQPLRGPGGHRVGTLCVVDTEARDFGAEDLAVLDDLAAMVEAELSAVALGGEVGRLRDRQAADARERDLLAAQAEELVAQKAALRASEDRFRTLAEAAFEGIAVVEGGRVTQANAALARLLGYDQAQDLVGMAATAIADPDSRELVEAHVRSGYEGAYEAVVRRRDGTRLDVEVMARMVEQAGRSLRVTAIRDIGARKALDRAKEQFVAVVSHDLRNPLNALALSLSMLEDEVVPVLSGEAHDDATYALDVAQKSVKRLIRLTEDLLDGERLATGQVPFRHAEVPARELFAEAAAAMRAQAARAGVAIEVAPTDARVWGDPDKLMQVLANLVGNAIKFSPAGGTVRLAAEAGPAGVTLRVADEGRGVPADKREAIFERFVQVEAADATEKGGTGLGLAICRAIVDQHGGRIWVDSEWGHGSTFQVALPAPAGA